MFSNFKNAFISKPQFSTNIPPAIMKTLNSKLPEGFSYIQGDEPGICILTFDGEITITSSQIILPEKAKAVFPDPSRATIDEVMAYCYNTQYNPEILPDADGYFVVNGEKIHKSKFAISPLNQVLISDEHAYMQVPPFPPPFQIEVGGNDCTMTLTIQRQTHESISINAFESIDKKALHIKYTIDTNSPKKTMNINLSFATVSSAEEIVRSRKIFNAFVEGKGLINDTPLGIVSADKSSLIPDEVIRFWEQVTEIEEALQIEFDATQDLTQNDIRNVNKLYRSIIENKPFRINKASCTLHGTDPAPELTEKSIIGQEFMFGYSEKIELSLLGQTIELYSNTDLFGGQVSETSTSPDGTFSLVLMPAKEKEMYAATQYYTDEKDMLAERTGKKHISIYQRAQLLD